MGKAIIHSLIILGCAVGAIFVKNDTWSGILIGSAFTSLIVLIELTVENWKFISLLIVSKTIFHNKLIRFSISYLYKIKVDDKYFLVKGKRIDQFQPVGGVYKRHLDSKIRLKELGVLDDNCMPIDGDSRDDLRVRVPGRHAVGFINWFNSKQGRELSRFREFCEELLMPNILDSKKFPYIDYSHIETIKKGIRYSKFFQSYEYLIADIVELRPTRDQIIELKKLMNSPSNEYIWVNDNTIRRLGYNLDAGINVKISETSEWIL